MLLMANFKKAICYISIVFKFIMEVTLLVYHSLKRVLVSIWAFNDVNVGGG